MSTTEKQAILESFKNLPETVQMAMIAGKALADTERAEKEKEDSHGKYQQ